MKAKFLILITSIALLTACDNAEEMTIPEDDDVVEITFNSGMESTTFSEGLLKTDYERPATFPAYISGLNIKAEHQTLTSYPVVDSTFYFVDVGISGGEPMTMKVKYGSNLFTAETVNLYGTINGTYLTDQKLAIGGTLQAKASAYADYILANHPLYAKYTYQTTVDISLDDNANAIDLALVPENGRVNVVMETEEVETNPSLYGVARLYEPDPSDNGKFIQVVGRARAFRLNYTDRDNTQIAAYAVFNTEEMVDGTKIGVEIYKDNQPYNYSEINVVAGENITYVLRYKGTSTSVVSGSVKNKMVFEPVYE